MTAQVRSASTHRKAAEDNIREAFQSTSFKRRELLLAGAQAQAILDLADAYRERTAVISEPPDGDPAAEAILNAIAEVKAFKRNGA